MTFPDYGEREPLDFNDEPRAEYVPDESTEDDETPANEWTLSFEESASIASARWTADYFAGGS